MKEIIGQYKKANQAAAELKLFNEEDLNFEEFNSYLDQNSIFSKKKLLILINALNNSYFKEKFLRQSDKFIQKQDIILFYQNKSLAANDKLLALLKKKAKAQKFDFLAKNALQKWIIKKADQYKIQIDFSAVDKLVEFIGSDLWQLDNEIKKLAAYKKNISISSRDVETMVRPKIEAAIFKTIDAIAGRDKKRAFLLINQHLSKGDTPLYLLSMISFQFRNLLMVKELMEKNQPYYVALKQSKLHPFVFKKSYQQTRFFSLPELKKIYRLIFQVDFDIKTGRLDSNLALDMLIASL